MATLYSIFTHIDKNPKVNVFVDSNTPTGHFIAAILDGPTSVFYLLRGELTGTNIDYVLPSLVVWNPR